MMPYRRCREKFHRAVYRLAVSEGDVRMRLRFAYSELRQLDAEDVPENLREEFVRIINMLTQRGTELGPTGLVYRSAVDHTLDRMINRTGRKIAERILALDHELG